MASSNPIDPEVRTVRANDIDINVATIGRGPAVLLLHGWPHTWRLWHGILPTLASHHRVIAPDLRGLGKSTRAEDGYDLHTLADDAAALLDALQIETASVVGIDLGVQIAWMLMRRHPERVERLAVMEGLLGRLPGAEAFLASGPPWWFGFHSVPGLAENVLQGNEQAYVDWFLKAGTKDRRGIDANTRNAFVNAYGDRESLRAGFAHYRAFGIGSQQIAEAATGPKTRVPVLAISGGVVGDALARQLDPLTDRLETAAIGDCAHLIPLEQPDALGELLQRFILTL